MSKLLDQSPSDRTNFVQSRWQRIRGGALEAAAERTGAPAEPVVRTRKRISLPLKRYVAFGAALIGVGLMGNLALAWMRIPTVKDVASGETLFAHKWVENDPMSSEGDGLGPVFNARSCAECHFQGGVGGGGDQRFNVASFEVLPTLGHPQPTGGVIHAKTAFPGYEESKTTVASVFPIVPQGMTITAVCTAPLKKDYDPVIHHSINTPTLFGAGKIDRIPVLAIRGNHAQRVVNGIEREMSSEFDRPGAGRVRILPDGRIGKFGWKAQFATLEEFVANACAVEVGLTTPSKKQHKPQEHCEDPNAKLDLNRRQFAQLVAYVDHLPEPELVMPADPSSQAAVRRGQELFSKIGCADCHTPDLGGAKGVYSDFCLHDVVDPEIKNYVETPEVPVPEDHPRLNEWKTPPLWGVGQTAPYLHDGSAPTLKDAILNHGGQARGVRSSYEKLNEHDQQAVVKFLESLAVKAD